MQTKHESFPPYQAAIVPLIVNPNTAEPYDVGAGLEYASVPASQCSTKLNKGGANSILQSLRRST
jgi:hypothetical protein